MTKIYWFCGHEHFQPEDLVMHAQLAEKFGFDGVMVSDHFHPWVDDQSASGFAFATLGAMAAVTEKVQLMTAVAAPLFRYHPALMAQAAATIDRLSSGRFALGVGMGRDHDELPLGYDFPAYAELSERLREALEIMSRLLGGEKLTYKGKYYQTKAAKLYSPPLSQVPIFMAAGAPKSAVMAGKTTNGIIASVKDVADTKQRVLEPALQAKKSDPFTLIGTRWSVYAKSDDEAWQALQAWRGLRAPNRDTVHDPTDLRREADKLGQSEILKSYGIVGSIEDFIATYAPLITDLDMDIIGIQCTSMDVPALIELLGREVVPELKKLKGGSL